MFGRAVWIFGLGWLLCWAFVAEANPIQVELTLSLTDEREGMTSSLTPSTVQEQKSQSTTGTEVAVPGPSSFDAMDPRRLVRYFCRMWKEEEYNRMYWTMTPQYRASVSLEKFKSLFEADAERTGGLKDENIVIDDVDEGKFYIVTVDLRFNLIRTRDRRVKAVLEKGKNGYRIKSSGIIPLDLDDL